MYIIEGLKDLAALIDKLASGSRSNQGTSQLPTLQTGIKNVVDIESLDVADSYSCSDTCSQTSSQCSGLGLTLCFTIQQNSDVKEPSGTIYWVQNSVEIGLDSTTDAYVAAAQYNVWDATGGSNSPVAQSIGSFEPIPSQMTITFITSIVQNQVQMMTSWGSYTNTWYYPCENPSVCFSSLDPGSYIASGGGLQPILAIGGPPQGCLISAYLCTSSSVVSFNSLNIQVTAYFQATDGSWIATNSLSVVGPGITEYANYLQLSISGQTATFTQCPSTTAPCQQGGEGYPALGFSPDDSRGS